MAAPKTAKKKSAPPLAALPQVDRLARELASGPDGAALAPARLRALCADGIARLRERLRAGKAGADEIAALPATIVARARALASGRPRRVINATGILVHTNLGRAPLGAARVAEIADALAGYSDLEFDLATGARGRRDAAFVPLLELRFPGFGALAVNNCAAAMLLALETFSRGKETVISRGELIEIGEGFRVPDIFAKSGALLREVGTTNRTRIGDYARAAGKATGLLLRVHRSNFAQVGFTESASTAELAALGARKKIPVGVDLGGGLLDESLLPLREETVEENLAAGAGFVAFSGDKLFGGPQAGIVVGRPKLVAAMRANPLYRALRLGKESVLPLNAVLRDDLRGGRPPALAAAWLDDAELRARCERLARSAGRNPRLRAEPVEGEARVGGGAAPGATLPTPELALRHSGKTAAALLAALRDADPPVIARIAGDRVRLNPRTLLDERELDALGAALERV